MSRRKINPILLAGGVVVIVIGFLLFVPYILGATAGGADIQKYNGTSDQGNETVRIAGVVNTFYVGMTSTPMVLAAFVSALFVVVMAALWVLKKNH